MYHQTQVNFTLSSDLRYKLTLVKELGECRWHWITVLWLKQYWLLPLPKSSLLWDTDVSGGWFQFVSWKYQPSSHLDCSSEYYRELQVSFAQKPQTCLHVPLWYNIWTERERESMTSQKRQCLPMFWLQDYAQYFTALLKNTRILKFKSQITFEFFAAVNHLSRPFRKHNFTLTGSKGHGLWFVFGRFRSFLCFCVSMFIACDMVIMIEGNNECN